METNQLKKLKGKVFGKSNEIDDGGINSIIEMAKGLGCLPDIIGRDYEVKDASGKIIYTIRQKPMSIKQMNTLLKEFNKIQIKEDKRENEKFGMGSKNKKQRLNKKR